MDFFSAFVQISFSNSFSGFLMSEPSDRVVSGLEALPEDRAGTVMPRSLTRCLSLT